MHQKVEGSIPGQVAGSIPGQGAQGGQRGGQLIDVFLSHQCFSSPLSLSLKKAWYRISELIIVERIITQQQITAAMLGTALTTSHGTNTYHPMTTF